MEIKIDLQGLAPLNALPELIAKAEEKALLRGAIDVRGDWTAEIGKTYARDIPTRGEYAKNSKKQRLKADGAKRVTKKMLEGVGNGPNSSKPAWDRSSDLKRTPTITQRPGEVDITLEGEAVKPITNYDGGYAEKIQTLKKGPDGVDRRNPFIDNTVKATEKTLPATMENEFKNALGL